MRFVLGSCRRRIGKAAPGHAGTTLATTPPLTITVIGTSVFMSAPGADATAAIGMDAPAGFLEQEQRRAPIARKFLCSGPGRVGSAAALLLSP